MSRSSADLPPTFTETRLALQALAEHVLSAALHRATGRIGLRALPGGFGTPPFADPGASGERRLSMEGTDLVVTVDGVEARRESPSTLAAAGELVGIDPGAPREVYEPVTPLDPAAPLRIDPTAASVVAECFAITSDALEALRVDTAADDPSITQLWPEHFDLAITAAKINFGGSPGDADHLAPYLYVGPWEPPPQGSGNNFWNEPFGASRSFEQVSTAEEALDFFRRGRELLL